MLEYKLLLSGVNCSVVEWNPDGQHLLFAFHGWLDNLATFEPLIPFLDDIRFIAVDLPGHGHSDHIQSGYNYHFLDGIFLIDDLLDHFEITKANLLGHSMGGKVGMTLADKFPDLIEKLVVADIAPKYYPIPTEK